MGYNQGAPTVSPSPLTRLFSPVVLSSISIALQIKWSLNVSWTTLKQILSVNKEVATKIKRSNVPLLLLSNYSNNVFHSIVNTNILTNRRKWLYYNTSRVVKNCCQLLFCFVCFLSWLHFRALEL